MSDLTEPRPESNADVMSTSTGSTDDVRVRRASAADAAAMTRLHARSWPATYGGLLPDKLIASVIANEAGRTERWRRRLEDRSYQGSAFVAERGGRVVGLAFWGPGRDEDSNAETAEVEAIYLDPDAIGQGVGRMLFAATVEDIASRGFSAATLWVLDSNARARRFYEAAGWRPDGAAKTEQRPDGALPEVRYRRDLAGTTDR